MRVPWFWMLVIACGQPMGTGGDDDGANPDAGMQPDSDVVTIDEGPLAGMPSPPGPHIAMIQALGARQWLPLGAPAPDPQYGVARGRSWGGRAFSLAPGIRGAFFTGEGVHAYVKPDGRAMDDIFVYDINAHRWVAVYPGTDPATFNQRVASGQLKIDDNGQLVDANNEPVPVHILIHAWDYLSFDTDRQQFAMLADDGMGRYFLGGESQMDPGLTTLEMQRASKTVPPMSPWFYDLKTARFERYPTNEDTNYNGYDFFQYVASRKQYVHAGGEGVRWFDPATRIWTTVAVTGSGPPGYDHGGCYDAKRERLYLGSGNSTAGVYILDLATGSWTKPPIVGDAPQGMGTNSASVFCDSVNDVVVVFHCAARVIYEFDPASNAWTSQAMPTAVTDAVGSASSNAFFDPGLNAYFLNVARDSNDNISMFVYRHGVEP